MVQLVETRVLRLYGRSYDATKWALHHPGGAAVIESASTLSEGVAEKIFENSHRNIHKNLRVLDAYALADSPRCSSKTPSDERTEPLPDAFRDAVRRDVYAYLARTHPSNPRGEGKAYALAKCAGLFLAWLLLLVDTWRQSALAPEGWWRWWAVASRALAAGGMLLAWGFVQFHDASHFAFAGGAAFNRWLTASWCAVAYWPPWLWHKHHVELHHTCTGDYERDPDLRHGAPFMRKTDDAPSQRYLGLSALAQLFTMVVAPGMYFGQTMHYTIVRLGFKTSLWKMSSLVPHNHGRVSPLECALYTWFPLWIAAIARNAGWPLAFAAAASYIAGANATYSGNILPDHDTIASHANLRALRKTEFAGSWAASQVAASANWGGRLWCFAFGGINYQIEHHLFPMVHHQFYPELAPVVSATCRKFGVPYVHYPSFASALLAVYRQIQTANADILS